jgi:undecaprenyl-diphosphatase
LHRALAEAGGVTGASLAPLDARLFELVNVDRGPLLDAAAVLLSSRLFGVAFVAVLIAALFVTGRVARFRCVLALALALPLSDGVGSQVLKPAFGRVRPCYALAEVRRLAPAADVGSLPSLHAANFSAMATVAAAADPRLAAVSFTVAAAVAWSRVHVGVHWPGDVLAGAAWGACCGCVGLLLSWRVTRRAGGRHEGASQDRAGPRPEDDGVDSA